MPRTARAGAALLAFLLLATPIAAPPPPGPGEPGSAALFARPVPLNPEAPDQLQLGPLRYLGGWELSSDDRRFGAISGLAAEPGGTLLALSDRGILFRFAPPGGEPGRVAIHPFKEGPGGQRNKIGRDSEALALADGRLWVGYENSNEIWRYASNLAASAKAAPAGMRRWPANRGAEAMLRLADGRFLIISEDEDDKGVSAAFLFLGDPAEAATTAVPLRVDARAGQRVTDGAQLPDGRLLLLTRGFSTGTGWTARLLVGRLPERAGELIATQQVASFEAPLTRDNMEGLAVAQEGERVIVWIASDDNLIPLQRSLLLKFEWVGE